MKEGFAAAARPIEMEKRHLVVGCQTSQPCVGRDGKREIVGIEIEVFDRSAASQRKRWREQEAVAREMPADRVGGARRLGCQDARVRQR